MRAVLEGVVGGFRPIFYPNPSATGVNKVSLCFSWTKLYCLIVCNLATLRVDDDYTMEIQ